MTSTLLIADDDEKIRRLMELILGQEGYRLKTVPSGQEALRELDARPDHYDLMICDLQMPHMTGMQLLEKVKKSHPEIPVLMITGYGTIKTAVEAMRKGAFDYITKPIDHEELKCTIKRALIIQQINFNPQNLGPSLPEKSIFENFIGQSEKMQQIKKILPEVADTDYTVLITGESGTGKELLARAIHYSSPRSHYPMITINCGAIPESLLESELFGYKKGAFTDAQTSKPGRLKLADGGTVFLDELAELSPMTQVKLLRVLQEKEIEPLGDTRTVKVDIRIVAATNKELFAEVKKGRFREDLYYRVNVFPIHIPPLRERKEDIPDMLDFFLSRFNCQSKKKIKGFSPRALEILVQYPWPGNVRELVNLVERMMILCKNDWIEPDDLPPNYLQPGAAQSLQGLSNADRNLGSLLMLGLSAEELESQLIREALEKTGGNVSKAARILKTTRNTLRYRIGKYGLSQPYPNSSAQNPKTR